MVTALEKTTEGRITVGLVKHRSKQIYYKSSAFEN
jgi:hypothetical protein